MAPVEVQDRGTPSSSQMWEHFLAGMEVFVEAGGQRLPGPNYHFLGQYEASKEDILRHRLKVGIEGWLVMDLDGKGHHHGGEATEEQKRAVLWRLEGYNLTRELSHPPPLHCSTRGLQEPPG